MKKLLYILLSVAAVGCTNVDIYDTDHPGKGKLTLTTDWTNSTAGVTIPTSYTAESGGQKVTLTGTTTEYPNLLDPGTYTLNLYNTADKITVSGTTATAQNDPQLGFQFWGTTTQTIEQDKDHSAKVMMKQITKQLEFDLTVSEGIPTQITGITATLSGIAGAWDCAANGGAGAPSGTAITISPVFTRTDAQLKAMVRILGTIGATQTLILDMTLTGGKTHREVVDLSSQLASFNTNKTEIAKLTGDVKTPILVNHSGNINDWTPGGSGDIEAN